MKNLNGKSALVTGAASGIGRAIALELAQCQVDLFLVDLDQAGLAETADMAGQHHCRAIAHVADLTQSSDVNGIVERLLARWNGVDLLVNNAGVAFYGSTHAMSDRQWQRILAVNLLAPIELTRKLLPSMLERYEAHVLNVCSIAGLVASPRLAAYHTTKFGLVGFSEALRAEYGPRGLGVTALCPGFVRTNIYKAAMTDGGKPMPQVPTWCTTSPQRVARRAIRAIRGVEGVVVVTPAAQLSWRLKRFAPGLIDLMYQFRWRKRVKPSIASKGADCPAAAAQGGISAVARPAEYSVDPARAPDWSERSLAGRPSVGSEHRAA